MTYVHISDQGRNEHDPKLKKCTFIDYSEDVLATLKFDSKGYKIWLVFKRF